jgi:hypothetical protein
MCSTRILAETSTILIEVFVVFISYYQENTAKVPRVDHDPFLPNPFQFIMHHSSYHSHIAWDSDSLAQKRTDALQLTKQRKEQAVQCLHCRTVDVPLVEIRMALLNMPSPCLSWLSTMNSYRRPGLRFETVFWFAPWFRIFVVRHSGVSAARYL